MTMALHGYTACCSTSEPDAEFGVVHFACDHVGLVAECATIEFVLTHPGVKPEDVWVHAVFAGKHEVVDPRLYTGAHPEASR